MYSDAIVLKTGETIINVTRRLKTLIMKKSGKKRTGSAYWREVSQLFTKAGAFGIINLFSYYNNTNENASVNGKAINHSKISSPQKEFIEENIQGLEV